jgi:hypothetical protein
MVTRACVPTSACSAMNLMIAGYGVTTTCCITDLCNSAESNKIKAALFAFALSAALVYLKK